MRKPRKSVYSKRSRSKTQSERREDEIKRSYQKLIKDSKEGEFILISRLVQDLARHYFKGSMVDFMLILMDKVDHYLKEREKHTVALISMPGIPCKLALSYRQIWIPRSTNSPQLVVVEVDENFVGYRIDNLKNMIVSQAVDDILSKN